MSMENELSTIVIENRLPESKVAELGNQFAESFDQAQKLIAEVKDLTVTDANQTDLIEKARRARLKLKNIRVEAEKIRKSLKEQSLREGKAVDGVANIIKALIVPIEEQLEAQEKFAELQAAKRRADRLADRTATLSPYVEDISVFNLADMDDESFDKLLSNSKKAYAAEQKAIAEAEAERKKVAAAEAKRQKAIEQENIRLKKEAADKAELERKLVAERSVELEKIGMPINDVVFGFRISGLDLLAEPKQWKILVAEAKKRIKAAKDSEARKAKEEAALAAERKAAAAAQAKAAKLEQEKKDREAAEAKVKAKAEADERAKALGPDKDKLNDLANRIEQLELPEVKDDGANKLLAETVDFLARISKNLRNKAGEL